METESFGDIQRRTTKGKVVGDTLEITPAMPPRPPGGPGGPGGGPGGPPRAAGPGGGPGGAGVGPGGPAGPGGPGGFRGMQGAVIARRGTPTPTFRAPSIDYRSLPKIEMPALKDLAPNGLAKTPPMGWNSWNKFRTRFDDKTVREIADAIVASGMKAAGYQYINIDDGWQWKRDASGVLQPNPNFPNMKALADYVHSKGLKLGIYSSPGPRTCAGYEGSYGHEEIDAKTWAAWGIDYLKYDWCSAGRIWKDEDMRALYQRMGEALRKAGRPIVYSLCQYGRANVGEWGPKVGGNLWRTTFDIRDQHQSMDAIGFSQHDWAKYAAPGQWNDPDMLEIGNGGMNAEEYRTHMSLWSLLAAPLIAGNDIRSMDTATKEILLNKEIIAVDQDPLGKAATRIAKAGDTEVWARPLKGGAYAVGLFNRGGAETSVSVKWADLQLNGKVKVRDLWAHADRGAHADSFEAKVPSHGVVMLRLTK
ncbi:MAG: glycoside hydrolase family 27 protein [Acidobacteria bacterium]|nr:glycoside hydrolase family 27 protein [Acidobacteriota bacterium]